MSVQTPVDYTKCFTHSVLTKIHGQPSYNILNTLKKELKANATGVVTDLGGGCHGYYGLVVTPAEYTNV